MSGHCMFKNLHIFFNPRQKRGPGSSESGAGATERPLKNYSIFPFRNDFPAVCRGYDRHALVSPLEFKDGSFTVGFLVLFRKGDAFRFFRNGPCSFTTGVKGILNEQHGPNSRCHGDSGDIGQLPPQAAGNVFSCLLYTSDAADD